MGDRQERFKAPNDSARELREALVAALLDHTGHDSLEAFRAARAGDGEGDEAEAGEGMAVEGLSPLGSDSSESTDDGQSGTGDAVAGVDVVGGGGESVTESGAGASVETDANADVAAELAALREQVERQGERIDAQRELIDQLIEELRRGR
jgi:hypothetical protein